MDTPLMQNQQKLMMEEEIELNSVLKFKYKLKMHKEYTFGN